MKIVRPVSVTDANLVSNIVDEADEWSASTPTDEGIERIYNGRLYESLEAANTDQPDIGALLEAPTWLDLGAINRLRMFDGQASPQSIRANNIDVTVTPSIPISNVSLINVVGNSVTVQQIDSEDGVVYAETRSLIDNSGIDNIYDYLFEPIEVITDLVFSDLVFQDLPNYTAPVRIVINAGSGTAAVGEVIIGFAIDVGDTLWGTSPSIRDYSRVEQNDFGDYEITRRRWSKLCDYDVVIDTDAAASVIRTLSRIRSRPALFIGDDSKEETIIFGFYTDAQIVLEGPFKSELSIETESLPYESLEDSFSGGAVSVPTVDQPEEGFTVPDGGMFISSAFEAVPDTDSHESSSWQFATDAAFASIVWESLSDVANLTEIVPDWGYFTQSSVYYVRVLHRGLTFGDSPWSPGVSFVAGPELNITTPTITSPEDGDTHARSLNITSSAFAYSGDVVTAHEATQWQIATDAGFTMLEYDDVSESSLTTLAVPSALTNGDTLYVRCRYRDSYGIFSSYSTGVEFVVGEPLGQIAYTTPGASTFVVPANVTRVSVVVIGAGQAGSSGGSGGSGGSLAYADSITVTPGQSISINVSGPGSLSSRSRFKDDATLYAEYPINFSATGYGGSELTVGRIGGFALINEPSIGSGEAGGGGGAAGYSGNGGSPYNSPPKSTTPGASAAGAGAYNTSGFGGNGGGVGLLGPSNTGAMGATPGAHGTNGSAGQDGQATRGGNYGGGGGGAPKGSGSSGRQPGPGAVRIIYGQLPNGSYRAYPSTGVADM
ncbi:hypothetical protein [Panacagrimonas sp.]|uniref:glycine-rich domain-containing protein n=1 Tax=Panacagrimonas sp. TaxID=2480088 RepID=UPI003B526665